MDRLRRLLSSFRHAPDRLLHPRRRSSAEVALHSEVAPDSVLFICLGNICRSPYAEHRFRQELITLGSASPRGESAGFIGPARPSPPELVELAAERGLDLAGHRSRLATPDVVAGCDLVVVMEPRQARLVRGLVPDHPRILSLGDCDPDPIVTRAIPDPWGQPRQTYSDVLDRIDRSIIALARMLARDHSRIVTGLRR